MDFRIETSRLVLRPWTEDDIGPLAIALNEFEIARWLAFVPHPYTTAHASAWVERCRTFATAGDRPAALEFAVDLKSAPRLIGGVSLSRIDWRAGTAGGGLWIARHVQGHGYGREAFAAKIRFAFRDLGLAKLVNGYFDGNEASAAMQRRLGYRRVGAVPSRCMADGRATIEHVTDTAESMKRPF